MDLTIFKVHGMTISEMLQFLSIPFYCESVITKIGVLLTRCIELSDGFNLFFLHNISILFKDIFGKEISKIYHFVFPVPLLYNRYLQKLSMIHSALQVKFNQLSSQDISISLTVN